jgi:hypothetical protein
MMLKIPVTDRQLRYELNCLKTKLKLSDVKRYQEILAVKKPKARPLFKIVEGGIEVCERR